MHVQVEGVLGRLTGGDYISSLDWDRLGVPKEKLEGVAGEGLVRLPKPP